MVKTITYAKSGRPESIFSQVGDAIFGDGDAMKTAEKFAFYTLLPLVITGAIQYIETAPIDVLDLSVRSVIIGGIVAAWNLIKHR